MNRGLGRVEDGARVAIVGGGPAGCFFALYLLRYGGERGLRPEITIYEKRDFGQPGPVGCKGCAGILSTSFLRNLTEMELRVPDEIVQSKIDHYAVHSPYTSLTISNPERGVEIASVYRGGGPRLSRSENLVSFDEWLLKEAQGRGVRVENQSVARIHLGTEAFLEAGGEKRAYDLIVLACGVNTRRIPIGGTTYVPPETQIMAQDELYAGGDQVQSRLGNTAHVFLIPRSGLIFGTLVPKGPFINVSVLSSGKHPISVRDFLSHEMVRQILPDQYEHACGCRPRIVVGPARNYCADRFVAVGDAVVSRLYKDGIGSSLLTAREAARTAACHGISRHDFERYYMPFCNTINRDNRWGRLLFSINDRIQNSRAFLLAQQRLVGEEQGHGAGPQPFTRVIWGIFTGSYNYRSIARMALGPASLARLGWASSREALKGLLAPGVSSPKKLHVGRRRILILGSGFGGTYTLRHLVRSLNRNENMETTMVSDENFFLFSPLLHEVAMGGIETRHIAYPIRRLHWRDRFNFIQAEVEKIDLGRRQVITSEGTLDFDYLVLALGSITDMSELPSLESNVFTLKTLHDAMVIRNHIISLFEKASVEKDPGKKQPLLTFIVCGGGYTGIQLVAELRDFIFRNLIKFYRTIDAGSIRILLVEAERKIVTDLHTKLGAYIMRELQRMGIEVRMRSRVTRVWPGGVELNGKETVPTNTLLWVAGVLANPRIAELGVEKDSIGRVLVNRYLEVPGAPEVYALGDCAHFEDPRSGQPIPPRAHNAVRQARVVAHNILAEIRGRDKRPYRYAYAAEMVSLGASKAVLRFHGWRLYGFPARLIWLAAYSSLVAGAYNRVRIATDWLLSLLFGRDTTFLKQVKK